MAEHDLTLIRLVAGRYRELQGLRRVVDAGSLVFLWSLLQIGPVDTDSGPYMLASLTWAALTMRSAHRVVRYYRERFGSTPGDGTKWDRRADARRVQPDVLVFTLVHQCRHHLNICSR